MAIGSFHLVAAAAPMTPSSLELAAIVAEIDALRTEQSRRADEMRKTEDRLAALETTLARLEGTALESSHEAGVRSAAAAIPTSSASDPVSHESFFSGDVRVRYEANSEQQIAPNRYRGVVRARLKAGYTLSERLYLGGMLSTGDPANPRTGDVTLTGFGADLQAKLAQAYLRGDFGALQVLAGKIPQPFQRTELVWDGDVNPQGLAGHYRQSWDNGGTLRLSGLYFLVDEAPAGPDSDMIGGQLAVGQDLAAGLRLDLAAAYYDYRLETTPGSSAAALRGNLAAPGGGYLSDFNLANGMVTLSYSGLGPRWPARLALDYVRNLGAAVTDDSGFGLDLTLGRGSQHGDWRLTYGYAEAGVDAVLAAFSSDNTDLPTNYLQHSLAVDYVISPSLTFNATAYHYRPKNPAYAGLRPADEWLDRIRLNLQVTF